MSNDRSEPDTRSPRFLLNGNGSSFDSDIGPLGQQLERLSNTERKNYRNANAEFIARSEADRLLIVAGPGSGKSYLFLARIRHWLAVDGASRVYVSSFVRKVVIDLKTDVASQLQDDDVQRVTVSTLHELARSILERNHGASGHRLGPHISIVTGDWMKVVWADAQAFHAELGPEYSLKSVEKQFHEDEFADSDNWPDLLETYFRLSRFYNAVGFPDMIALARRAVDDDPTLVSHSHWIIDEFQDFNSSENHFVQTLTARANGVLIAGDDEQALYQELKSSLPEIIISYYEDDQYANAMLPYCSRCGYWICLAAAGFMATQLPETSIKKIYLPLEIDEDQPKVRVIATSTPSAAVDYIKKFVEDHRADLDAHVDKMMAGEETDPFLLILNPKRQASFYKTSGADAQLMEWLAHWAPVSSGRSADYRRVAAYCTAVGLSSDNYVLRRVLHYEGLTNEQVHPLIERALDERLSLSQIESEPIADALRKCFQVSSVMADHTLSFEERVRALTELIHIADSKSLIAEIEVHPMQGGIWAVEEEGDEAVETAGALSPVEMLTMVGSKGLSSQHVIVIGCDDVNMNNVSRLTFFVAMTRARKSLYLITSLQTEGSTREHQYIGEIPEACCDFAVYKKTGRILEAHGDRVSWSSAISTWTWIATQNKKRSPSRRGRRTR